jgi:hypothetical protein
MYVVIEEESFSNHHHPWFVRSRCCIPLNPLNVIIALTTKLLANMLRAF